MANERGTYGTVKLFGEGMLAGGLLVGFAALLLAVKTQEKSVAEINAYRPRYT